MPAAEAVQLNVAVKEPVPLAGLIPEQVSPGDEVSVNATVPLNPLDGVIVTVQLIEDPTVVEGGVQLSVIVKSTKLKVAVAE